MSLHRLSARRLRHPARAWLLWVSFGFCLCACGGETAAQEAARRQAMLTALAAHGDPTTWQTPDGTAPLPRLVDPRTGIVFVRIPAGEFRQGPPGAERTVRVTAPFLLAETELTVAQWRRHVAEWGGDAEVPVAGGDDHPMTLSWQDAQRFCERFGYRLPTEAEWERACRADHRVDDAPWRAADMVREHAWWNANAGDGTHAVRGRTPNAFGLYDMLGNVWEWCADWYGAVPFGAELQPIDPTGPARGDGRVLRGASWFTIGNPLPDARTQDFPDARTASYGVRPARSL